MTSLLISMTGARPFRQTDRQELTFVTDTVCARSFSRAENMFFKGLLETGISCRVEYASTRFFRLLGYERASFLLGMDHCAGEAVFAELAGFTPRKSLEDLAASVAADYTEFFRDVSVLEILQAARGAAEACVEETVAAILSESPRVVGISSSFQQQNAALAILARIKKRAPISSR